MGSSTGRRNTSKGQSLGHDKDMKKAEKYLTKKISRKTIKQNYKNQKESAKMAESLAGKHRMAGVPGKNFAQKTIWGQNIVEIRSFNVDKPKTFEFLGSYDALESMPTYPLPEIAFLGRSNVGKSSLLNCLTGQHKALAVVSKTPGRTQLMNMFKCSDSDGDICVFVDLPGYGFAKMSRDQQVEVAGFLRAYLERRGALRYAALLVDARRDVQDQDMGMAGVLEREGLGFSVVATKLDKLKPNERERSIRAIDDAFRAFTDNEPIGFSSVTGEGKKMLWRALKQGLVGTADEVGSNIEDVDGEERWEKVEAGGDNQNDPHDNEDLW